MTDLNRQIAEIDGFTNVHEDTTHGGIFGDRPYADGARYTVGVPDYLAPENLRELVRILTDVINSRSFLDNSGWKVAYVSGRNIYEVAVWEAPMFHKIMKDPDLSAALAEAIVESAK